MRKLYDFESAASQALDSYQQDGQPGNTSGPAPTSAQSGWRSDPLGETGVPGWARSGAEGFAAAAGPVGLVVAIGPTLDWLDPTNSWHTNATADELAAMDAADAVRAASFADNGDANRPELPSAPVPPPATVAAPNGDTTFRPPAVAPAVTPPAAAVGETAAQVAAAAQQRAEAAARTGVASTSVTPAVTPSTLLQSGLTTSPTAVPTPAPAQAAKVIPLPALSTRARGGVQSTLLSSGRSTTGGIGTRSTLLGSF